MPLRVDGIAKILLAQFNIPALFEENYNKQGFRVLQFQGQLSVNQYLRSEEG